MDVFMYKPCFVTFQFNSKRKIDFSKPTKKMELIVEYNFNTMILKNEGSPQKLHTKYANYCGRGRLLDGGAMLDDNVTQQYQIRS